MALSIRERNLRMQELYERILRDKEELRKHTDIVLRAQRDLDQRLVDLGWKDDDPEKPPTLVENQLTLDGWWQIAYELNGGGISSLMSPVRPLHWVEDTAQFIRVLMSVDGVIDTANLRFIQKENVT